MKTAFKLAWRNLIGAGLRTWLNVLVLSFSYVVIIWMQGVMAGWDYQAKRDMSEWQIADGQYWHQDYDPYDLFTLAESHAPIPQVFEKEIQQDRMMPLLLVQGTLYPEGRLQTVIIKGIDPKQNILKLPSHSLDTLVDAIPAFIGQGMARNLKLEKGDRMLMRWRDEHGTFDAEEVLIVDVFASSVPAVEAGQIYVPLETLEEMTGLHHYATLFVFREEAADMANVTPFVLKTKAELTRSVDELIKTKQAGQSVFYIILLLLAMLAIFDTQVLSVFRRQKEIGTYVALGYTRRAVVRLFTVEGGMHAVLAAVAATAYGLPFLAWQAKAGWTMPMDVSEYGLAIAQTLYPKYSVGLVVFTILLVLFTTTLVSYLPSRKIAKMNPTDALRGKIQ